MITTSGRQQNPARGGYTYVQKKLRSAAYSGEKPRRQSGGIRNPADRCRSADKERYP
jgi:hypothetical protein